MWLGQIKRFPKASPKLPRDVKLNHYTALRFGANESRTRAADLREFLAGAWGWQDGDTDDSDSDVDLRPTRRAGTGKPYICKRRKLVHAHCREFGLPCSDSD